MTKSELLGDHESLHLAKMLIEEHGDRAACHARGNADRLMRVEDVEGGESWMRIAQAVELLLQAEKADMVH
jgi:hypothetical protein